METNAFDVYRGKTVLITGNTGFKGSWLSLWLLELGARVVGYSLDPPTDPSLFNELQIEGQLEQYNNDIRDVNELKKCLRQTKPDFIFHLAAQTLVRESFRIPYESFDVNVMGTVSLLEAIRELKLPTTIILVTSDKSYENQEWLFGYRENDPMGGYDPYSASKGAAEIVISSYSRSFFDSKRYQDHGVKIASVRAGNVIGGGDWAKDRIVPDCINHLVSQESIFVRSPEATRPWQHVLEPLGGYLSLGSVLFQTNDLDQIELLGSPFNFGPLISSNKPVRDLVEEIIKCWGSGKWHHHETEAPHEASLLNLTVDKAYHLLKWLPVWGFEKTVKETINWYKNFYQKSGNIQDLTLAQIKFYQREFLTTLSRP